MIMMVLCLLIDYWIIAVFQMQYNIYKQKYSYLILCPSLGCVSHCVSVTLIYRAFLIYNQLRGQTSQWLIGLFLAYVYGFPFIYFCFFWESKCLPDFKCCKIKVKQAWNFSSLNWPTTTLFLRWGQFRRRCTKYPTIVIIVRAVSTNG